MQIYYFSFLLSCIFRVFIIFFPPNELLTFRACHNTVSKQSASHCLHNLTYILVQCIRNLGTVLKMTILDSVLFILINMSVIFEIRVGKIKDLLLFALYIYWHTHKHTHTAAHKLNSRLMQHSTLSITFTQLFSGRIIRIGRLHFTLLRLMNVAYLNLKCKSFLISASMLPYFILYIHYHVYQPSLHVSMCTHFIL